MIISGKKTILVAEDDSNDAFLLKSAFQETSTNVSMHLVTDGEELIKFLAEMSVSPENSMPELVLLDLNMPRMDGFEVIEWIRKQPGLKRLPVIVFSSSVASTEINRAYELGANSYLIKPFDFRDLTEIVRRLLGYWFDINQSPNCWTTKDS